MITIYMNQKNRENQFQIKPETLQKTPTNIEGLDDVLHGGVPTGRLTIVNGGPGSGKTVLGLELLVRGAESGRPAVFISFEETNDAIRRNALSMGWDLASIEKEGKLVLINPELDFEAVLAGEFNIKALCAIIAGQARRIDAELIVIDAIDMLLRMFRDTEQARNQLLILHRWLNKQKLTTIMTVKSENNQHEFDHLDYMADCVIWLDQRVLDQINTRRLIVKKYRGSDFSSREHPFVISRNGIMVMPLTFVDLVQQSNGDIVSTGNSNLNDIMGGGYRNGSSVLISGPSGSGKTSLAFMITDAAVRRGERVLYMSFEQSQQALEKDLKSIGLQLNELLESGLLRIISVIPESMGMEEHLHNIIGKIDEFKPDQLVLDAITATSRIGSSQAALEFLIRLYLAAKKRGITCIYTNQLFSTDNELRISGAGISSLVDTAIILSYFREGERLVRKILVLKSRGTRHSLIYHKFDITDNGIIINDPTKK